MTTETRNIVVARLPRDLRTVSIRRAALARLIHRRVPALAFSVDDAADEVRFQAPASQVRADSRACFAAATPIPMGEVISATDLARASCTGEATAPISYDRTYGLTRAGADIGTGDYLGSISVSAEHMPDTGDALTLLATAGATQVERPVTAAQPASRGRALFVRDQDGNVFAVPFVSSSPIRGTP
ncbi:MAG: hypothetical protein WAU68_12180 [Vitreimonas sp.]